MRAGCTVICCASGIFCAALLDRMLTFGNLFQAFGREILPPPPWRFLFFFFFAFFNDLWPSCCTPRRGLHHDFLSPEYTVIHPPFFRAVLRLLVCFLKGLDTNTPPLMTPTSLFFFGVGICLALHFPADVKLMFFFSPLLQVLSPPFFFFHRMYWFQHNQPRSGPTRRRFFWLSSGLFSSPPSGKQGSSFWDRQRICPSSLRGFFLFSSFPLPPPVFKVVETALVDQPPSPTSPGLRPPFLGCPHPLRRVPWPRNLVGFFSRRRLLRRAWLFPLSFFGDIAHPGCQVSCSSLPFFFTSRDRKLGAALFFPLAPYRDRLLFLGTSPPTPARGAPVYSFFPL